MRHISSDGVKMQKWQLNRDFPMFSPLFAGNLYVLGPIWWTNYEKWTLVSNVSGVLSPPGGDFTTPQRQHAPQWKSCINVHFWCKRIGPRLSVHEHLITNSKSYQWFTCFRPDTQLPCYNKNVKIYTLYDQVYVQATSTSHSWLNFNVYITTHTMFKL